MRFLENCLASKFVSASQSLLTLAQGCFLELVEVGEEVLVAPRVDKLDELLLDGQVLPLHVCVLVESLEFAFLEDGANRRH